VRPFLPFVAVFTLLGVAAGLTAARAERESIRFVRIPTQSPVTLDRLTLSARADKLRGNDHPIRACISFTDRDTRTAKTVRVQFAYYDGAGDRAGGTLLTRNGTFSTGVISLGSDLTTYRIHPENCVALQQPRKGFSAVVAYIDGVDFVDGTNWASANVRLANHVAPGSPNVAFSFTDVAAAPNNVSVDAAELSAGRLAPLFLGTVAGCSAASAPPQATLLFDPAVVAPVTAARNVFVTAEPGSPLPGNLFTIGTTTVCAPSGNAEHDRLAIDVVRGSHVAIRQAQAFRIAFPVISTSTACTDGVRILNRVLETATPNVAAVSPARPGEYVALVRVDVAPDGHPASAVLVKSAGPPEFDDAARRSALASHYWPAIAAGKAVAGTFDFAMRWVVDPERRPANVNARTFTTSRIFGPEYRSAATACAV
jgi:hypothetical protein